VTAVSPLYHLTIGSGGYTANTTAKRAKDHANAIRGANPEMAAVWDYIAAQVPVLWCAVDYGAAGGPSGIRAHLDAAQAAGEVPVFVFYTIPNRDNGNHSAPDEPITPSMYRQFMADCFDAIDGRECVCIFEPDGTSMMYKLGTGVNSPESNERKALIRESVVLFKSRGPQVRVYIDAGDNKFRPSTEMAAVLAQCGIELADGISLNVAHTESISSEQTYFFALKSKEPRIGGYVFCSARAAFGPYNPHQGDRSQAGWCCPPPRGTLDGTNGRPDRPNEGVGLGFPPTNKMDVTGYEGLHLILWIKFPGTSDGSSPKVGDLPEKPSTTAPEAGKWYPEYWEACWRASKDEDFSRWAPVDLNPAAARVVGRRRCGVDLKQGVAVAVLLGPFLAADGVTPLTTLAVPASQIRLSKAAGDFSPKADATALVHVESGFYRCQLSAVDTGTPGSLTVLVAPAGSAPIVQEFRVGSIDSNVVTMVDGVLSSGKITDGACRKVADFVMDEPVAEHVAAGTLGFLLDSLSKRLPAALVSGKMDAQVGPVTLADASLTAAKFAANAIAETAFASNAITARVLANNAFNAGKFDSTVGAEFREGVATSAEVNGLISTLASLMSTDHLTLSNLLANISSRIPPSLVNGRMDAVVDGQAQPPVGPTVEQIATAVWATLNASSANKLADHVIRRAITSVRTSQDGDPVAPGGLLDAIERLTKAFQS
jgi:hypothetical protein